MHEVGIMESALALVAEQARERRASRVERVVLRIGTLSGVEMEALRFAFDVVSRGTVAEGATLEVEAVSAASYCPACRREFEIAAGFIFVCPSCGELCGEVRRGRELELSRIELS
jgi:hydrogenase nickel incorporation protein HypA/HybF